MFNSNYSISYNNYINNINNNYINNINNNNINNKIMIFK